MVFCLAKLVCRVGLQQVPAGPVDSDGSIFVEHKQEKNEKTLARSMDGPVDSAGDVHYSLAY